MADSRVRVLTGPQYGAILVLQPTIMKGLVPMTNRKRNTAAPKLTHRGVAVLAAVAVVLVLLVTAVAGHVAALVCVAGFLLVNSRVAAPLRKAWRTGAVHRKALRGFGWASVAGALWMAADGTDVAGGATLGLVLAAALATALHYTKK